MLRFLIVIAITLPALADAQARGFRLSFRSRATSFVSRPTAQPAMRSASSSAATLVVFKRDGAEQAAPFGSAVPGQPAAAAAKVIPPLVPPVRVAAQPANDRAAHWCDNGAIVGSGKGFCVVKVGTDGPT